MEENVSNIVMLFVIGIIIFAIVGLRGFSEWSHVQQAHATGVGSSTTTFTPIGANDPGMQLTDPGAGKHAAFNNQIKLKLPN